MSDIKEFQRQYLPKDFKPTGWKSIKPYMDDLVKRRWKNADDYLQWLKDWDELTVAVNEEGAWRYINKTRDTENKAHEKAYLDWDKDVVAKNSVVTDKLNKRMVTSLYNKDIDIEGFGLMLKGTQSEIDLFRKENIPLKKLDTKLSNRYGQITSKQTVVLDNKKMTFDEADVWLEWPDRSKREESWRATAERALQDKDKLDDLFTNIIKNRHQIALNAGFKNYRDYQFKALGRDYTPEDCFKFHDAVEKTVVPIIKKMTEKRRQDMGLETLRPWDFSCDAGGLPAIVAFNGSQELIDKAIAVFDRTMPVAAKTLRVMQEKNLFDLDTREGKEGGAYNIELYKTGSSFMFANQAGTTDDVNTIIHETGHATHLAQTLGLGFLDFKDVPMELAELAAMSMELLVHDDLSVFYPDEKVCDRVRLEYLSNTLDLLPSIAKGDLFQHKVYENPGMSANERHDLWADLQKRFSGGLVDYNGLNREYSHTSWQGISHFFENPFYFIEYGFSQMGAYQIWRNSKQDKEKAIQQYGKALTLGYTRPVPEVYKAAGAGFDFGVETMEDLMGFVSGEIDTLLKKTTVPKLI